MRAGSTVGPTATMSPQASAPWMRGKLSGAPVQPASSTDTATRPASSPTAVARSVTDFEYQPVRMLMSVFVDARRSDAHEHFARARNGNGQIGAIDAPIEPVVTHEENAVMVEGSVVTAVLVTGLAYCPRSR